MGKSGDSTQVRSEGESRVKEVIPRNLTDDKEGMTWLL